MASCDLLHWNLDKLKSYVNPIHIVGREVKIANAVAPLATTSVSTSDRSTVRVAVV